MLPDFIDKWEHILHDVDKDKIPIDFVKKIIIKIEGKRQHTINIEKLLGQGLDLSQIEIVINSKLFELDTLISQIEFILNIQKIAEIVQPETDKILNNLK